MKPRYGLKPGKQIRETKVTWRDLRAAWYAKQEQGYVEAKKQRKARPKRRYQNARSSWSSLQRD